MKNSEKLFFVTAQLYHLSIDISNWFIQNNHLFLLIIFSIIDSVRNSKNIGICDARKKGAWLMNTKKNSIFWRSCAFDHSDYQFSRSGSDDQKRIWDLYDLLRTAHLQHGIFIFQFRYMELYFSDPAGHHTDDFKEIFLSRLFLLFHSRTGIR